MPMRRNASLKLGRGRSPPVRGRAEPGGGLGGFVVKYLVKRSFFASRGVSGQGGSIIASSSGSAVRAARTGKLRPLRRRPVAKQQDLGYFTVMQKSRRSFSIAQERPRMLSRETQFPEDN